MKMLKQVWFTPQTDRGDFLSITLHSEHAKPEWNSLSCHESRYPSKVKGEGECHVLVLNNFSVEDLVTLRDALNVKLKELVKEPSRKGY